MEGQQQSLHEAQPPHLLPTVRPPGGLLAEPRGEGFTQGPGRGMGRGRGVL